MRLLFILGACLSIQSTFAKDVFVKPDGSDTGDGSSAHPYQTLQKAQEATRTAASSEDVHIYLSGGVYTISAPLEFTPADSGKNGHAVTYQNAPGETPILFGGKQISGWTVHDPSKNIWQATVSPGDNFRQLYVNGVKAIRARSDNANGIVSTPDGYTATLAWLKDCKDPGHLEVVASPHPWEQVRIPIASAVDGKITVQEPCWSAVKTKEYPGYSKPDWIENAYELLTKPGYWYLDRTKAIVYYIPRPGEDLKSGVEVPTTESFIRVEGSEKEPVSNLQFIGLQFRIDNWLLPSTGVGFQSSQANQLEGNAVVAAAIDVRNANNILIQNCEFQQLGGNGVNFITGVHDSKIDHCAFHDLAGTAVQLARGNNIDNKRVEGDPEIVSNIVVSNCTIHDVDTDYQSGCGIFAGWVEKCEISHNELFNLPYGGISIGWGWTGPAAEFAQGNRIIGNKIHNYLRTLADSGGIYCNGAQKDALVEENYIYDQQNPHYGMIYLDDGATNWTVRHNVLRHHLEEEWLLFKGHNHHVIENYTESFMVRDMSDGEAPNFVDGTMLVAIGNTWLKCLKSWPPAAEAIMKSAGPQ